MTRSGVSNDERDALKLAETRNKHDAIRMLTAWKEGNVNREMMAAAAEGKLRLVTGLKIYGAVNNHLDNIAEFSANEANDQIQDND